MCRYSGRFPHSCWKGIKWLLTLCQLWELFGSQLPKSCSLTILVEFHPMHTQFKIQAKTKGPVTRSQELFHHVALSSPILQICHANPSCSSFLSFESASSTKQDFQAVFGISPFTMRPRKCFHAGSREIKGFTAFVSFPSRKRKV